MRAMTAACDYPQESQSYKKPPANATGFACASVTVDAMQMLEINVPAVCMQSTSVLHPISAAGYLPQPGAPPSTTYRGRHYIDGALSAFNPCPPNLHYCAKVSVLPTRINGTTHWNLGEGVGTYQLETRGADIAPDLFGPLPDGDLLGKLNNASDELMGVLYTRGQQDGWAWARMVGLST
jgi:hypothetical protein